MRISINKIKDNLYQVRSNSGIYKSFGDSVNANQYANGVVDGYYAAQIKLGDKPCIIKDY